MIWGHLEKLEWAADASEPELLGLPRTIIIYDSTNMHYCGCAWAAAAQTGQKRHDRPLMTSAPTLDGIGFPQSSQMLR